MYLLTFYLAFSVPNVYPVDLFEHVWVVDRLQRLGISRYFEPQIKECINYVDRYASIFNIGAFIRTISDMTKTLIIFNIDFFPIIL